MTPTSQDLLAAVRVHADRVHDAVRRLGCSPTEALEVVTESALNLIGAAAGSAGRSSNPQGTDLVDWWFARARALGQRAVGSNPHEPLEAPLGSGLLAADQDQTVLADVLQRLPDREQLALLLRDSYALTEPSLATALGISPDAAMELVVAARRRFLAELDGAVAPALDGHRRDLPALARLAEGRQVAAHDATTRRHVQSCSACQSLVQDLEQVHLLLAGLTIAALPDADRGALLLRVEAAAHAALPSSSRLMESDESDDQPRRLLSPFGAVLLLGLAVLAGLGLGLALSRGDSSPGRGLTTLGTPTPSLAPSAALPIIAVAPPVSPAPLPSPTVFTVAPSPRTEQAASSAPSAGQPSTSGLPPLALTMTLDQTTGPNDTLLTVQGTGWPAGQGIKLDYLDQFGRPLGASSFTTTDARGDFTATIRANDPTGLPGRHRVRGISGGTTATTTYDAT